MRSTTHTSIGEVGVDGRPVYTYAGDDAPGDVKGQGLDDVWWAVAPDGIQVTQEQPVARNGY